MFRIFIYKLIVINFFLFFSFISSLAYSKNIQAVFVKGNTTIKTALILTHISAKAGQAYSKKKVTQDVRQLFSLGFFDDIKVKTRYTSLGLQLVYQVKELVQISKITFTGHKQLQTKDLEELFLIQNDEFLNPYKLQKSFQAIKQKYHDEGYYKIQISYKLSPISKSKKQDLVITITENNKLFIKKINFIGNRNISSRILKSFIHSKEQNIFSFLGGSGVFKSQDKLDRDVQILEYYYRDQGYLQVRVKKPEITITPDKKFLYITFPISEGPRLKIGQIFFQGDEILSSEDVQSNSHLVKDAYFSISRLQKDLKWIENHYKDQGYAFAKAHPQFYPDRSESSIIHINFKITKGSKYKLRHIHIRGNTSSRDKIFLRRIYIREGEFYNESKKQLSHHKIQQLGYFEDVNLNIIPVISQQKQNIKQLDLMLTVKEKENTGEATAALGFSSETKMFITAGFKKQNFLGLNQNIALDMTFNESQEVFNFNYQILYFLDSPWDLTFTVFNVVQDSLHSSDHLQSSPLQQFLSSSGAMETYSRLNTGFSTTLGRHLTSYFSAYVKYKLQKQSLSSDSLYFLRDLPVLNPIFDFIFGKRDSAKTKNLNQPDQQPLFSDVYDLKEGQGINSLVSLILEYDKRNNQYYTTDGFVARLFFSYSGLGGDFDYSKIQGKWQYYYSPFWKLVIKNNVQYARIFSNKSSKKVPFTELFTLGGSYNLRGFDSNSQGPRKHSQQGLDYALKHNQKYKDTNASQIIKYPRYFAQKVYGGTQMFFYTLELEIPIIEKAQLRAAVFFDIGEANNKLQFDTKDQLRMDVGIGLRWKSPFGPINLDLAMPYKPREKFQEKDMKFQFSFGSLF